MEQRREPVGTSAGGQFAPDRRAEASGELDLSRQGTFRYPPALSTADDMEAFWRNCEVSDEVLDKLRASALATQRTRFDAELNQWEAANPIPRNDQEEAELVAARDRKAMELNQKYLGPAIGDLRTLARLNRMRFHAGDMLPDDEREELLSRQFELPVTRERGTADELLYWYGADTADLDKLDNPDDRLTAAFIDEIGKLRAIIANSQY